MVYIRNSRGGELFVTQILGSKCNFCFFTTMCDREAGTDDFSLNSKILMQEPRHIHVKSKSHVMQNQDSTIHIFLVDLPVEKGDHGDSIFLLHDLK